MIPSFSWRFFSILGDLHLGRGHFPGFVKNRVPINDHGLSWFIIISEDFETMVYHVALSSINRVPFWTMATSGYFYIPQKCIFAQKDHMTNSMTYSEAPSTQSWRLARRDGTGLTTIKRLVMAGDFSTRFLCCNGDMNPTARRTRIAGI